MYVVKQPTVARLITVDLVITEAAVVVVVLAIILFAPLTKCPIGQPSIEAPLSPQPHRPAATEGRAVDRHVSVGVVVDEGEAVVEEPPDGAVQQDVLVAGLHHRHALTAHLLHNHQQVHALGETLGVRLD